MQNFDFSFQDITARFDGVRLTLKNGRCARVWQLQDGWNTVFLGDGISETNLIRPVENHCDWKISACSGSPVLIDIRYEITAENFLRISSEFHYQESQVFLRHEIDCYPGVSGFRIRISLKGEQEIPAFGSSPERDTLPQFVTGYTESVPLIKEDISYTAFGLNNDSQHRYTLETPILTEINGTAAPEDGSKTIANCNGIIVNEGGEAGFVLVKESHKCANSPGVSTGEFLLQKHCLRSTGLGFSDGSPHWLSGKDYHAAWANWCIPFSNGKSGAIHALKEFDRSRFPFRKERDMFIAMNTWGSRGSGDLSRCAATEENVLSELESCADLGIDLLQIDDGWQFDPGTADFQNCAWEPSEKGFPHGWEVVKKRAAELNMKLGLWAAPDFVSAEQLLKNIRSGGFRRIKLDFLNLTKRVLLDDVLKYAQTIIDGAEEPVGINWDITECSPRMGFFFGREYGNIFLQNCENSPPGTTCKRFIAYDPEVTLNQTWLLAKYFRLNQVQITIQRIAESIRGKGYPQDYACGIALMGNPLFFMETNRFTAQERVHVKNVLSVYKKYREDILNGDVSPIGSQPDGSSWTGFQCISSERTGYLTIFREKDAMEESGTFKLDLPTGKKLRLTGLYGSSDMELSPSEDGKFVFSGLAPMNWAFYQYEVIG